MSATALALPEVSEADRVEVWREDELRRAGYPEKDALLLARDRRIDLHFACDLLVNGCPLPVALRILR